MVAYWYPQLAVYDDVNGWQKDPYLGGAEFYMGYADYDVNLSVPQGWLVAATGELTNAQDVLSQQTRDRLPRRVATRGVVHVVREQRSRRGTQQGDEHRLRRRAHLALSRAQRSRLRLGTSSKYLWDATIAAVGDRDGDHKPDTTLINTFYRPEAREVGVGPIGRV